MNNLGFNTRYCKSDEIGFITDKIKKPQFMCADYKTLESKYLVFTEGFYKILNGLLNIAYLYPKFGNYSQKELIQPVAYEIYHFCNGLREYNPKQNITYRKRH